MAKHMKFGVLGDCLHNLHLSISFSVTEKY